MKETARPYEAAYADRPHPDKGHDRIVADERSGSFAVFDGAGDAQASALAARIFSRHSSRPQPPDLAETFQTMQGAIRRRHPYFVARAASWVVKGRPPGRSRSGAVRHMLGWHDRIGLTTGTAVRLETDVTGGSERAHDLSYAHAGDSTLYLFDRRAGRLDRLTEDEAVSDTFVSDTTNFLGSEQHVLRQAGRLALPAEATLALLTDGVNGSGRQYGLNDAKLGEILSEPPDATMKAAELVAGSPMGDDASVIVIEYQAS